LNKDDIVIEFIIQGCNMNYSKNRGQRLVILFIAALLTGIVLGVVSSLLVGNVLQAKKDVPEQEENVIEENEVHEITEDDIDKLRENAEAEALKQEEEGSDTSLEEAMAELSEPEDIIVIDDASIEEKPEEEAEETSDAEDTLAPDADTNTERGLIEILKESLINGEGTLPSLRKVFPDQTMVVSEGKFFFFPINNDLKQHGYSVDNLTTDDKGRFVYTFEDGSTSRTGVDVSKYQGIVDWEKVKNDGIDFAIIRSGVRGYGSGKLVMEEDFLVNAASASAQGLEIGTYFFSQAINEEEAVEEAESVIEALSGYEIAFPVVYDLERVSGGRMNGLSKEQVTNNCLAFCERIKEAGYEPMLYGNMETFMLLLDMSRLEEYEKWFAYYNNDFYFPYNFRMWQYTESGRVDGIAGDVDLNILFY